MWGGYENSAKSVFLNLLECLQGIFTHSDILFFNLTKKKSKVHSSLYVYRNAADLKLTLDMGKSKTVTDSFFK